MATRPEDEVRTLTTKIPKRVHKALTIHCTLQDKPTQGIVALALERFLDANGDAMVKNLLRGGKI